MTGIRILKNLKVFNFEAKDNDCKFLHFLFLAVRKIELQKLKANQKVALGNPTHNSKPTLMLFKLKLKKLEIWNEKNWWNTWRKND